MTLPSHAPSATPSSVLHRPPWNVSSSECLLLCVQSHPSTCHSSNIRATLRLLHSLQTLASLLPDGSIRVGGLFAGALDEVLDEEGSEVGTRIRQRAELMKRVRSGKLTGSEDMEEAALWAVLENAVVVQVGEAPCRESQSTSPVSPGSTNLPNLLPDACYQFESPGASSCSPSGFRVWY